MDLKASIIENYYHRQMIAVVGSSMIDIISTVKCSYSPITNTGSITLNYGGVGLNVAVNLSSLGVKTKLCTPLNYGYFSNLLSLYLQKNKVETYIVHPQNYPDPIYNAVIKDNQEIIEIWDNDLKDISIAKDELQIFLSNVSCLIIISSYKESTLELIIQTANELNTPVIIGVSSLSGCNNLKFKLGSLNYLFLNIDEMNYLTHDILGFLEWNETVNHYNTTIIVTKGKDGVDVLTKTGVNFSCEAQKTDNIINTIGAGDFFLSLVVKGIFIDKKELKDSIYDALSKVHIVLERKQANIGVLETIL